MNCIALCQLLVSIAMIPAIVVPIHTVSSGNEIWPSSSAACLASNLGLTTLMQYLLKCSGSLGLHLGLPAISSSFHCLGLPGGLFFLGSLIFLGRPIGFLSFGSQICLGLPRLCLYFGGFSFLSPPLPRLTTTSLMGSASDSECTWQLFTIYFYDRLPCHLFLLLYSKMFSRLLAS